MGKPTIICVDDEKIVLDSLRYQLKSSFGDEYMIEIAESGKEALEIIDDLVKINEPPHIIITDHIMPNMNGAKLIEEVKEISPKTLSIILTGQAKREDIINIINSTGIYRFISKPWDKDDLILTIKEAILAYNRSREIESEEQKFRTIYENNLLGIHINNLTSGKVSANQAFCEMIGYTQQEVNEQHLNFDTITHPDDLESSHQNFLLLLQGKNKSFLLNKRYIRKDGNIIDAITAVKGIYNSKGKLEQVFATILDVSDKKKAEEKIKEEKENFKSIFETNYMGIFSAEYFPKKGTKITEANPAFCKMIGYTKEEFVQLDLKGIIHPEEKEQTLNQLEQIIQGEITSYTGEKRFIKKDKGIVNVLVSIIGIYNESKKIKKILYTTLDISERKRSEKELVKLSLIASKTTNGVLLCDKKGRIEWCNESMERLTGYALNEMLGKYPSKLFGREFAEENYIQETIKNYHKKPAPFNIEVSAYKKSGDTIWLAINNTPIFDENNVLTNQVEIISDISERKKISQRILESIINAENEERNRISRELHDGLGQLVTSAKMQLEYLEKTKKLDTIDKIKNTFTRIQDETRNISRNMKNMILEDFGLLLAIDQLCQEFNDSSPYVLSCVYQDEIENLFNLEQKQHLYRIIQEAINNAIRHAQPSNILINLSHEQNLFTLIIQDDGKGFDYNKDLLFLGTEGNGLINMKERARLIGGTVSIESSPNNGTSLTLKIAL